MISKAMLSTLLFFLLSPLCSSFTYHQPSKLLLVGRGRGTNKPTTTAGTSTSFVGGRQSYSIVVDHRVRNNNDRNNSYSRLYMAGDDEGPGPLVSIGILVIMILFVGSGLLPLLDGGGRDLSIADSVVTRQDAPAKLQNYEFSQDRLSRATIQEKLSAIPVFYLVNNNGGEMQTDIYLSYEEASEAAAAAAAVKATSLDQVMYPLVLKRGRMRMASPPVEVEKAEAELSSENNDNQKKYRLVPSKAAVKQAREYNMDLAENDIPLFVADRLAFASSKGPQLPLFVSKDDCVLSYQRLRGGKSSLPEQPNIRTATLLDELYSMEKGTRPGVSQLAFYATADDVNKAAQMVSGGN